MNKSYRIQVDEVRHSLDDDSGYIETVILNHVETTMNTFPDKLSQAIDNILINGDDKDEETYNEGL